MNTYELFFILPGTLAETEVKPVVEAVTKTVVESGGAEVKIQDLGKSRLAYPMQHIRYGYFQVCRFAAEPAALPALQAKLTVLTNVLRVLVRKVNARAMTVDKISVVTDVFSREPGDSRSEAAAHRVDTTIKKEIVRAAPVAVRTETKAADVKLDDIDKKLDELLQGEIAGV